MPSAGIASLSCQGLYGNIGFDEQAASPLQVRSSNLISQAMSKRTVATPLQRAPADGNLLGHVGDADW